MICSLSFACPFSARGFSVCSDAARPCASLSNAVAHAPLVGHPWRATKARESAPRRVCVLVGCWRRAGSAEQFPANGQFLFIPPKWMG
eukprot:7364680-Pyramimonas_sp.AAC.2